MSKGSREHHGDEFGKPTSGAIVGLNAPIIGAAPSITLDGLVERESGITPSPWSISVKGIVIFLVAMFLFGLVLAGAGFALRRAISEDHGESAPPQRVTTYDPAWDAR